MPGVSDTYESSIIGRGLENRGVMPFVDRRLAMDVFHTSDVSDLWRERESDVCTEGVSDFCGVGVADVRGMGISAGTTLSGSDESRGGVGFLDLKKSSLTNVFTVCTFDTRADCSDTGAGCLDAGAGCLDAGAGCLDAGAGCLDTGACCLDAGAGCLYTMAGRLDTGVVGLDSGAGPLDTVAGLGKSLEYSTTLVIVNSPLCGRLVFPRGGSVGLMSDCRTGTSLSSALGCTPSASAPPCVASKSSFGLISLSAPPCAASTSSLGLITDAVRCSSLELTPVSSKVTSV